MKNVVLGFVAAGTLAAQSVGGPVLGYVVDGAARMRPIYGSAEAGHVGGAGREGVKDTWGAVAVLHDGTGIDAGKSLEGRWAAVQPGALLDATGRSLLIVGEGVAPWRLGRGRGRRLAQAVRDQAPVALPQRVSGDHDVVAPGQRPEARRQRVPGLAAHHDRRAHRHRTEVPLVGGLVPQQRIAAADRAVARHGGDENQLQTATGALIAGWHW